MDINPADPNPQPEPAPPTPPPHISPSMEVVPDAALHGGFATPISSPHAPDDWLMRNVAPLLVVLVALTAQIFVEWTNPAAPRIATPGVTESAALKKKDKPARITIEDAMAELPFKVPPQVWLVLWIGVILAYIGASFPDARALLNRVFSRVSIRPLPALRILDLGAVLMVYIASTRILALLILGHHPFSGGEERAAALILNAMGLCSGLLAAVLLAQHRAGSKRGSEGIWPFWTLACEKRSVWYDVAIGVLSYPPSVLIMGVCLYVNHALVYMLNGKQDEHVLMSDLSEPQSALVLLVFFLMATLGAAFFEELLFRGILYNVMRRYLGAIAGACVAGLIFAALHMIWSQILGLFVLALILTWLYDRTGRLVAGMTLHAVNNLVALIVTLLAQRFI